MFCISSTSICLISYIFLGQTWTKLQIILDCCLLYRILLISIFAMSFLRPLVSMYFLLLDIEVSHMVFWALLGTTTNEGVLLIIKKKFFVGDCVIFKGDPVCFMGSLCESIMNFLILLMEKHVYLGLQIFFSRWWITPKFFDTGVGVFGLIGTFIILFIRFCHVRSMKWTNFPHKLLFLLLKYINQLEHYQMQPQPGNNQLISSSSYPINNQ